MALLKQAMEAESSGMFILIRAWVSAVAIWFFISHTKSPIVVLHDDKLFAWIS
jgi:hypothetical protein